MSLAPARGATIESMQYRRPGTVAVAIVVAVLLVSCATSSPAHATPTPIVKNGCVTESEATRIWMTVNHRLGAIELDPHHAGASAVTTGDALTEITTYLEQQLVAHGLTEHEVDRLDRLTVVQAGCNGGRLSLNVIMTLVQDDYLKAGGAVDHRDPAVGRTLNLLQEYVQSGGAWKESAFSDLTPAAASPTPQLLQRSPATLLYLA
jgi:hypothetical protein